VILQGSLTEVSGCKRRNLEKGSIVFTPPGEIHQNIFRDKRGRCFLVEFLPAWNDRLTISGMKLEESVEKNNTELIYLAFKLYTEFRFADNLSALSIEGLSLELLAAFGRQLDHAANDHSPSWLQQAKDLLHDSFAEPMTLADIAVNVGVHPVHLSRAFRKLHRCSLGEYQRKLRIEYAATGDKSSNSRNCLVRRLFRPGSPFPHVQAQNGNDAC
jgi:AraC family transcriptional regulator